MQIKLIILFLFLALGLNFAQNNNNRNIGITINNAWIRTSAMGSNTALFFEVVNSSDKPDTLLSAESKLAKAVEVHETFKRENDMMGMRKVKFVVIPPNNTIKFKPRDLHVMLINLNKDMKPNDKGEVTLVFKTAGKIKVNALVRDMQMTNK
ncbi:MAG: copper chaperone PCu(A)C [Bacteroidota bacterium]|jgi:copper(I)-binding protein